MSTSGRYGDVSAVLYLVPFLASGVYGIYLWFQAGLSYYLPSSVYLSVTRDPYVFMLGSFAIMAGVVLDLRGVDEAQRKAKLTSLGGTLQSIAIASLILVVISAFYANGFTNVGSAASDFIVGRYGLVFPATLVLLSYLVTARFDFSSIAKPRIMGLIALLLVPASIYEVGKHYFAAGLGLALVLMIFGVASFILPDLRKPKAEEK